MPASDRAEGRRRHQKMTLLLLLVLTAGLAGQVHCEDGEEETGDPEANEESDILPAEDTGDSIPVSPSVTDKIDTTEDPLLSGSGELSPDHSDIVRSMPIDDDGGVTMGTVEPPPDPDPDPESDLNIAFIIVPFVLFLLIVAAAVAFVISRRRTKKQHVSSDNVREDDVLSGCDTEKIPMPMFEDDVPSVLELEMEDLEKWMVKDQSAEE